MGGIINKLVKNNEIDASCHRHVMSLLYLNSVVITHKSLITFLHAQSLTLLRVHAHSYAQGLGVAYQPYARAPTVVVFE